jgi:hypothetical protein
MPSLKNRFDERCVFFDGFRICMEFVHHTYPGAGGTGQLCRHDKTGIGPVRPEGSVWIFAVASICINVLKRLLRDNDTMCRIPPVMMFRWEGWRYRVL